MHLYVHVPFCVSKCSYCAFYSVAGTPPPDYADLISREAELRGFAGAEFETLYFGGGTPSLLKNALIPLNFKFPAGETTVECNPADITPVFAEMLALSGVTRVSIGAQSFDDETLRFLGRRHDSAAIAVAVSRLRHAGIRNISLDLIAAIPGDPSFVKSLAEAVALAPEHISVYPLSIEPGTEFHRLGISSATDDATMDELASAEDFLTAHGYERYEISNYCNCSGGPVVRPNCNCSGGPVVRLAFHTNAATHNLAVWQGEDYAAIGPSAASRIGLERRTNTPDLQAWTQALRAGRLPPGTVETLTSEEDERERFITGLRLSSGIIPTGERIAICERMVEIGLMVELNKTTAGSRRYALSRRGREVADAVAAEFS
ncbi:MAG: coproporphyrinogen III oxidase family protein [Kiritimatiellaeota bacterium]|nr:coproporphyrinogen III oxidase family protein [Kiritimatiellota bacterium]